MKPIEIENKKLHDLIVLKDDLVTEGRKITSEIEQLERKVAVCENKEKKITGAVKPDAALKAEGDALAVVFEETLKRLNEIGTLIEKKKLEAVPKELELEHRAYLKEIEQLERDRNKIALKIQKIKDKVIPIIQKESKPFLEEYDDIETAKTKNGKVVITTFNHLSDWKRTFKSRR